MNAFTSTIAFGLFLFSVGQDLAIERKAIARVQQTPVSQYDATLPNRSFESWLNQIAGPQAGVVWQLTECGEQPGSEYDRARDMPACVEVNAVLPSERKIVVQILIGTFRQGLPQLSDKTKFHFAVLEDGERLHSVQKLADLPQMARMPIPRIRLRPAILPNARVSRASFRLYVINLPPLIAPSGIKPGDVDAEVPPPRPGEAAGPRISKGVSAGDAITRVTPIYPAIAKQVNAYGEVQVEIEIDENGRVVEARAVTGHATLRGPAEDAARKWVFRPTLLGGTPVKSKGTLIFVFTRPQ